MTRFSFQIWQEGIMVAGGSGADAEAVKREAMHYAMVYAQDGPKVTIKTKPRDLLVPELSRHRRGA